MAALIAGLSESAEWFDGYHEGGGENVANYCRYVRDNDLFLTHALGNPQSDRSKQSHQQKNPYLHLRAKEETKRGPGHPRRQAARDRRADDRRGARVPERPAVRAGRRGVRALLRGADRLARAEDHLPRAARPRRQPLRLRPPAERALRGDRRAARLRRRARAVGPRLLLQQPRSREQHALHDRRRRVLGAPVDAPRRRARRALGGDRAGDRPLGEDRRLPQRGRADRPADRELQGGRGDHLPLRARPAHHRHRHVLAEQRLPDRARPALPRLLRDDARGDQAHERRRADADADGRRLRRRRGRVRRDVLRRRGDGRRRARAARASSAGISPATPSGSASRTTSASTSASRCSSRRSTRARPTSPRAR